MTFDSLTFALFLALVFPLDKVGRTVWGLLGEGRTLGTVIDEISSHYRVDRVRVAEDVSAFVGQLEDLGLGALRAG